jgi:hypothetical protein
MKYLAGVPDAEVNKITHENAIRLFHFDPFAQRPREKCTVAALRAESPDVDTSIRPRRDTGERKKVFAADLGAFAKGRD